MKNGVSFGLLLVVGAIGYYFGKKIGSFETAMATIECHFNTKKEETNQC